MGRPSRYSEQFRHDAVRPAPSSAQRAASFRYRSECLCRRACAGMWCLRRSPGVWVAAFAPPGQLLGQGLLRRSLRKSLYLVVTVPKGEVG
jgi:hypothetical protein